MKKIVILFVLSVLTCCISSLVAQHLEYDKLQAYETRAASYLDFTSYTASEGATIKIGDFVEFGETNGDKYKHIFSVVMGSVVPVNNGFSGRKYEVVRITLNGKNGDRYVGIWTKTDFAGKYLIDCEPALSCGELVGNGMTSDKALSELEKEKRKLDLGLITEEEYNKKKAELVKYIK